MKVLFDTKSVQKSGRIVLSDALLRNAGLQEGDPIDIYFDVVSKHIIIQKADVDSAAVALSGNVGKNRNKK